VTVGYKIINCPYLKGVSLGRQGHILEFYVYSKWSLRVWVASEDGDRMLPHTDRGTTQK